MLKLHIISRGNKWAIVREGGKRAIIITDIPDIEIVTHDKSGSATQIVQIIKGLTIR